LSPYSPTPYTHNLNASWDCDSNFSGHSLPLCPSFVNSFGPPDCEVLSILTVSFYVHEDQNQDGVGVDQPICDVICDDYVWDSLLEQESAMKVDISSPFPLPHYSDIFHDSIIPVKYIEESFSDHT